MSLLKWLLLFATGTYSNNVSFYAECMRIRKRRGSIAECRMDVYKHSSRLKVKNETTKTQNTMWTSLYSISINSNFNIECEPKYKSFVHMTFDSFCSGFDVGTSNIWNSHLKLMCFWLLECVRKMQIKDQTKETIKRIFVLWQIVLHEVFRLVSLVSTVSMFNRTFILNCEL